MEIEGRAGDFGFSSAECELAKGFALGAWIVNEVNLGRLILDDYNARYIHNMGLNCARMLKDKDQFAVALVKQLECDGIIEREDKVE